YILFAVLTWIAQPLFNLLLRLDRFGKHALSRDQVVASNWLAACLLAALLTATVWITAGTPLGGSSGLGTPLPELEFAALAFLLLVVPVCATFKCPWGWPRWLMAAITGALALLGLGSVAMVSSARWLPEGPEIRQRIQSGFSVFSTFVVGVLLTSV